MPLLWLRPYVGKGHGEGVLGPRGAGSVLCPFYDPGVWESEERGRGQRCFNLKEPATYERRVGLRREKPAFP